MTIEGLCKRVSSFGFALLEHGYGLDAQTHSVSTIKGGIKALSWAGNDTSALMIPELPRVDDYLKLVRDRDYSFLMSDGAAIQILYQYNGSVLSKHRLLYWPCPFDAEELLKETDEPIVDALESVFMNDVRSETVLRGLLRFDYDPTSADNVHPASHLTLTHARCRIPVHAPLSFTTFMRFVLQNFHGDAFSDRKVRAHLVTEKEALCLKSKESNRLHLAWRYA